MAATKRPGGQRGHARGGHAALCNFDALEIRSLMASIADVAATPAFAEKVGNVLSFLYQDYLTREASTPTGVDLTVSQRPYRPSADQPNRSGLELSGDRVGVEAVSVGDTSDGLRSELVGLGMDVTGQFDRVVSGLLPIGDLGALAELTDLRFATPAYRPIMSLAGYIGTVDDQAVQSLRSDAGSVRYGVNGAGVTVGILSDSFDALGTYQADVASGDLPANVKVLQELPNDPSQNYTGTDEGRGMAQLVYKVAPGASLAFNSAYYDIAAFAQGIINLAKPVSQGGAGAKVIVDDVGYENEPIFQDGLVAQAVNQAVTQYGVSYFSAAGNSGRVAYQSAFQAATESTAPVPGVGAGVFHNFATDGSTDIFQPITLASGSPIDITFQWDQPFASQSTGAVGQAGSANSLSIYIVDSTKSTVIASSTDNVVGKDPYQNIQLVAPGDIGSTDQCYVLIKSDSGPLPGKMEYIALGAGGGSVTIDNYATDTGAEFGHAQAVHAAGVGAVNYLQTPAWNMPASLETFSSSGGTALLFDAAGNRLSTPDLRQSPRFASVDGTDTTFFGDATLSPDGLPTFSGTSAAAPHAAAVAALLMQALPSLTSDQVYSALANTAIPVDGQTGFNFDSGSGLIQADRALAYVAGGSISGQVYNDLNGNGRPDPGEPGVAGASVFLDTNASTSAVTGTLTKANTTPLDIPLETDPTVGPSRVASSIQVSGTPGRVAKVTVTLDISEHEDSSLGVTLISPSGIRVPLFENVGLGLSDFNTITLDDSADTLIDNAPDLGVPGTYAPDVQLAALIGENPNGTWQLEARDFGSSDADGTLNSWSLTISYADPTATTDSQGHYALSQMFQDANGNPIAGLAASSYYGPYDVITTPPAGKSLSEPSAPYSIGLGIGQQVASADFGIAAPLVVTALAPTSTGFSASFSEPFNLAPLNLYDTATAGFGPADVTLVGATTGPVTGSLIVAPGNQSITFVKTGGVLAPDTYTLTLRSAANGFVDLSGNLLAGDGTPGHDYTTTFVVAPSSARVVSLPDFARGPGQSVVIPAASGSGLPLTISDGTGVTSISLSIAYNPGLLTITGANLGASAPSGSSVSVNTSTPGLALLTFTSPTALPAGSDTFASLVASVPDAAPYASKEALVIGNIAINGGAIAGTDGDGVHVVAYLGDTTGNGGYSSFDATLVRQVVANISTGFAAYPLLDPRIVGDIAGFGTLSGIDATYITQYVANLPQPRIPALPNVTIVAGGPDPLIWLPQDLAATPGSTLSVPVLFRQTNGSAIGLDAADLAIEFDPGVFLVTGIRLGDVPIGFTLSASYDNATGAIIASERSASGPIELTPGAQGTLLWVDLMVRPGASSGASRINLLGEGRVGTSVLYTSLNHGGLTLTPAPTDSDFDPTDGIVSIAGTSPPPQVAPANPSAGVVPTAGVQTPASPPSIPGSTPTRPATPSAVDPATKARPRRSALTDPLGPIGVGDLAGTVPPSSTIPIPWSTDVPSVDVDAWADTLLTLAQEKARGRKVLIAQAVPDVLGVRPSLGSSRR